MNGLSIVQLSRRLMIVSIAVIIKMFTVMVIEYAVYIIALIRSVIFKYGRIVLTVMTKHPFVLFEN